MTVGLEPASLIALSTIRCHSNAMRVSQSSTRLFVHLVDAIQIKVQCNTGVTLHALHERHFGPAHCSLSARDTSDSACAEDELPLSLCMRSVWQAVAMQVIVVICMQVSMCSSSSLQDRVSTERDE